MRDCDSESIKETVNWAAEQIRCYIQDVCVDAQEFIERKSKPSATLKPRLFIDGDQWCALYGENLQDGVCGFGASPNMALEDFSNQMEKSLETTNDQPK